jgi:hypothetical protein
MPADNHHAHHRGHHQRKTPNSRPSVRDGGMPLAVVIMAAAIFPHRAAVAIIGAQITSPSRKMNRYQRR